MTRLLGVARAGRAVDRALVVAKQSVMPGRSVGAIDAVVVESLERSGAVSSVLGYDDGHGGGRFSLSLSVCINDEIMGAGDPGRVIRAGDLVTLDLAASVGGWHADAAVSFCVPRADESDHASKRAALARASRAVTAAGIRAVRAGGRWSAVIDAMGEEAGLLGVVVLPGFDGHGIGRVMHEPPRLPMHPGGLGRIEEDWEIRAGMTLAIEPVVACRDTGVVREGWLDRSGDGSDACYSEVTVAVGKTRTSVLAGGAGWWARRGLERG